MNSPTFGFVPLSPSSPIEQNNLRLSVNDTSTLEDLGYNSWDEFHEENDSFELQEEREVEEELQATPEYIPATWAPDSPGFIWNTPLPIGTITTPLALFNTNNTTPEEEEPQGEEPQPPAGEWAQPQWGNPQDDPWLDSTIAWNTFMVFPQPTLSTVTTINADRRRRIGSTQGRSVITS